MKITHRDFYLEVARKQDELLALPVDDFWPEVKRLIGSSPQHGDVTEMFSTVMSEQVGSWRNRQPEEWDTLEDWKPYAKFAAMNHVFSLSSGDWRDDVSDPFPFPIIHREQVEGFDDVDREGWFDSPDQRDWTDRDDEFERLTETDPFTKWISYCPVTR